MHAPVALPASEWSEHHRQHHSRKQQSQLNADVLSTMHVGRPRSAPAQPPSSMHHGGGNSLDSFPRSLFETNPCGIGALTQQVASSRAEHAAIDRISYQQLQLATYASDQRESHADSSWTADQQRQEGNNAAVQQDSTADLSSSKGPGIAEGLEPQTQCLPGQFQPEQTEEMLTVQQSGVPQHASNADSMDARQGSALQDAASAQHPFQLARPSKQAMHTRRQREAGPEQHHRPRAGARWQAAQAHKLRVGLRHMPTAKVPVQYACINDRMHLLTM